MKLARKWVNGTLLECVSVCVYTWKREKVLLDDIFRSIYYLATVSM
jgi:hypothetical protein